MKIWALTVLAILARACVLLAFSEFVFFNEGPVLHFLEAPDVTGKGLQIGELILFYCLPGSLLLALEPMMTTWPRTILAGAFVGWSIEAAIVPVAYENPPFSFFWTSISWHALIDVCLGWVMFRKLLFSGRAQTKLIAAASLGGLTALWSTWAWSDLQLSAAGFAEVISVAVALLIVGYCLLRVCEMKPPMGRVGFWLAVGINLACWGLWAVLFIPISLGLAVMAALNGVLLYWAIRKDQAKPPTPNLVGVGSLLIAIPFGLLGFWIIEMSGMSAQIGEFAVVFVSFGGLLFYAGAVFYALRDRFGRK